MDDDDHADAATHDSASLVEHQEDRSKSDMPQPAPKPAKQHRLKTKSVTSPESSLQILDACLPVEPGVRVAAGVGDVLKSAAVDSPDLSQWLRDALFGGRADDLASSAASTTTAALTARIVPLANRMRAVLLKRVYAKRHSGSAGAGGWADEGRPAGFLGSGLGEELALAVFGRIQALRAKNVGKQVCFYVLFDHRSVDKVRRLVLKCSRTVDGIPTQFDTLLRHCFVDALKLSLDQTRTCVPAADLLPHNIGLFHFTFFSSAKFMGPLV